MKIVSLFRQAAALWNDKFQPRSFASSVASVIKPSPTTNQHSRSGGATKARLLYQIENDRYSQQWATTLAAINETVDAIEALLSDGLALVSPPAHARQKESTAEKTTLPARSSVTPNRASRRAHSTGVQHQTSRPHTDIFEDTFEKLDAVIAKFDELKLYFEKAISGFTDTSTIDTNDRTATDKTPALVAPIAIALPHLAQQNGHICKPTALANLDRYYAEKYAVATIPLRKNHRSRSGMPGDANNSVRRPVTVKELSKQVGSVQGELLEAEKYQQLANNMGYSTQILSPKNPAALKKIVLDALAKEQPLVTCFAVNKETGKPQSHYDDNEHACLITGCDPQSDTVDIAHWGQTFEAIPITDLFDSMNALPAEREQEIYVRRDGLTADSRLKRPTYKYDKNIVGQISEDQI